MGELRERMENDLIIRGLSPNTQRSYLTAVKGLAKYYRRRPDELSTVEVQRYLRHLIEERRLAPASVRLASQGIRFFYRITLDRPNVDTGIPLPKGAKRLPEILSPQEVVRILYAATSRRDRALLMTTYGAGLRVSEVVRLELRDLDSDRGLIRVAGGKGRKDRYTLFSERLREELRAYYRVYRPQRLLFPSRRRDPTVALDPHSAQRMFHVAKTRAGVSKQGGIHSLRHAFATHMLEAGIDLLTIQHLLGHRDLRTTAGYIQVATRSLTTQISPLDRLQFSAATEHR